MRGLALTVTKDNREARLAIQVIQIGETDIGLRIFAVSDDAPILQFANQCLDDGMIRTHDREAVERDVLDKGAERVLHGLKGLEMVQMFRIDVGNNRNVGGQL